MADLWDAVDWHNLTDKPGAKAGYLDGSVSAWPPEAWATFAADPLVRITVLAAPNADAYDGETGNAGPAAVATAIANEVTDGRHPWLYANETDMPAYLAALKSKGLQPLDRSLWPARGFYLWCSDPSGNIAAGNWRPPVDPVAVQDAWLGGFDHSTLYVTLGQAPTPAPALTVPPTKPPEVLVTVLLPQLAEGATGRPVQAAQTLLGDLATDGIFGPATKARVQQYQAVEKLAIDGVIGVHTWGALLGQPQ
jgi:peptidoglycan hydrolase-like protein with peptidoglycan-binding domain